MLVEEVKTLQAAGYARAGARSRTGPASAPDLSRYRRQATPRDFRNTDTEAVPSAAVLPQARAGRRAHRMRLSLSSALMFLVAFSAVMFIVYTYMQLSEMAAETSKLQKTLTSMKKENARLQSQADKQIDLQQLKLAAEEMGMVQPETADIVYLDLSGTDHAVILEKPGLWDSLMNAFSTMTAKVHEYFS